MKTKYAIGILILVAAVAIGYHATMIKVAAVPAPLPFPDVIIPGVPATGNCCLWQTQKKVEGARSIQFGTPYNCDTGQTRRGATKIKLNLSTGGLPCDQNAALIPHGSLLEAQGNTISRKDNFAHFMGRVTIKSPTGALLFDGTMETIDRLGTHHSPFGAEACNPTSHLEGYLVARGAGGLANYTLRALIVLRGNLPTGSAPAGLSGSIDGTLIKCP
ncbi:MAG: hypothetical protein MOB07_30915 [Acidobacteria bacterium]|nr:hypothetical protein [Acidobacteriota bacterium]